MPVQVLRGVVGCSQVAHPRRPGDAKHAQSTHGQQDDAKRPVKPKFKTINKESQFFYVENGQLQLLKTHTMKKALNDKGIEVVPFSKVEKKYIKQVDALLADATSQATVNFNAKVDVWNEWATVHHEEILTKR